MKKYNISLELQVIINDDKSVHLVLKDKDYKYKNGADTLFL